MTAMHEAPLVPAGFDPALAPVDALAASWLAEATLRLRRELTWLWQMGPARPGDALADSLDRLRHHDARRRFLAEDVTARYLGEQIAHVRALRPAGHEGRWQRLAAAAAGLDEAAQFVLALALAARTDAGFAAVAAACQHDVHKGHATLALAQRLWDEPLAIVPLADPAHTLYRFGLLRPPGAEAWQQSLDLPAALATLLLDPGASLPDSLATLAAAELLPLDTAAVAWLAALPPQALQIVPLVLPQGAEPAPAARTLAAHTGRPVVALAADLSPDHALQGGLPTAAWLAGYDLLAPEGWAAQPLEALLAPLGALPLRIVIPVAEAAALRALPARWLAPAVDVPPLPMAERRLRLTAALPPALHDTAVEAARRFRFNDRTLAQVTQALRALPQPAPAAVRAVCRAAAALDMGTLAQPVAPRFTLPEVVLPPRQALQLQGICDAMRALDRVHHDWGTARAWNEGGIAVLFCGPPGTGKTMAAEALAAELDLPMVRVDLSQVVNKYIGETEKNLRRVFDAAESADCLLFFDEADALFGKRTEVKDAHDRYANIEVSYLLERMERFKGLAVLASNRRKDIDEAFARRLRFVVDFPLPGPAERERLWRALFPPRVDVSALDLAFVAQRFELAGGPIRSAVFNACLRAAARGAEPRVEMPDLLLAVKREIEKGGREVQREQFATYAGLLPEHA